MARKFLYVIAGLVVLALAAAFTYRIWGAELVKATFVPTAQFTDQPAVEVDAYADPVMWFSRPGVEHPDPSFWTPEGYARTTEPKAAVFFIHPTSYLERERWNAPLEDREANERAAIFIRGEASAFNSVGEIWAPRYRQATFGAFLTDAEAAGRALGLAYRDVEAAFDTFLEQVEPDRPIILAGHSQGALHLTRLLRERVAGKPVAKRIVAAYVVGWPISMKTDIEALGLPACERPGQPGCILSWQSFAEPADPSLIVETYDATVGFNGEPRKGTPLLCVNPVTGGRGEAAAADANLGTLFPSEDFRTAMIEAGQVPARCGERGFLLIGEPPELGPYVLPGNNYHVFDYSLFWANIRADAEARLAAFLAR